MLKKLSNSEKSQSDQNLRSRLPQPQSRSIFMLQENEFKRLNMQIDLILKITSKSSQSDLSLSAAIFIETSEHEKNADNKKAWNFDEKSENNLRSFVMDFLEKHKSDVRLVLWDVSQLWRGDFEESVTKFPWKIL